MSANGDTNIGAMIAEGLTKVGQDGTLTIEEGRTLGHELEIVDGIKINRGWISPHFITDHRRGVCELEDAYILIIEKRIFSI